MEFKTRRDAQLFTHATKGGLYWLRGVSKGTGEDRGKELYIYTDYFTGVTYHREKSDWIQKMVPKKEPLLFFARRIFLSPMFCLSAVMFAGVLVFMNSLNDKATFEPSDILGPMIGAFIISILAHVPFYLKYWKVWVKQFTA